MLKPRPGHSPLDPLVNESPPPSPPSPTGTVQVPFKVSLRPLRPLRPLLYCSTLLLSLWFLLNERYKIKLVAEQEYANRDDRGRDNLGSSWFQRAGTRLSHSLSLSEAEKLALDVADVAGSPGGCRKVTRFGNAADGGWEVCEDDVPLSGGRPCVVYSIGINEDTSFDEAFVKRWPWCQLFAFDPSIGRRTGDPFLREKTGKDVSFFNWGLGEVDRKVSLSTSLTRHLSCTRLFLLLADN